MNGAAAGCDCARQYAQQWPDMTPAELAGVHSPLCPVRLDGLRRAARRAPRALHPPAPATDRSARETRLPQHDEVAPGRQRQSPGG